jgi:hypothetical protein
MRCLYNSLTKHKTEQAKSRSFPEMCQVKGKSPSSKNKAILHIILTSQQKDSGYRASKSYWIQNIKVTEYTGLKL